MNKDNWLDKIEQKVDNEIAKNGMPTKEELVKEIRLLNAMLGEDGEPHPC